MSADNICDVCLKIIDPAKPWVHEKCGKALEADQFKHVEDYAVLKKVIEKYSDPNQKIQEIKRDELASKPGLIILNNRVVALSLVKCNLTKFPLEVCNLIHLRELHLSNNEIPDIPDEIKNLTLLKELYLDSNKLTAINPNIQFMNRLIKINLNNNELTEIAKELLLVTGLEQLDIDQNKLTKIPDEIGNLWVLNHASLKGNTIEEIPETLLQINHLGELFLTPNEELRNKYPELELKEDGRVYTYQLQNHFRQKKQ